MKFQDKLKFLNKWKLIKVKKSKLCKLTCYFLIKLIANFTFEKYKENFT